MTPALPRADRRGLILLGLAAAAALLLLSISPDVAHAVQVEGEGTGSSGTNAEVAGTNIGDLIRGIAGPIVYAIGAIGGISAIFKRDFNSALGLIVLTILISVFIVRDGQQALEGLGNLFTKALDVR